MTEMRRDPIIDELRAIREAHAKCFNYDIEAMFRDLMERQRASGRDYVRLPPRRIYPVSKDPPPRLPKS